MTRPGSLRRVTRGMRFRATVVAVAAVGAVLAAGAVILATGTRHRLEAAITDRAETRALDLAALPDAALLGSDTSLPGRSGDFFGQVVAADGTVLASSEEVAGLPAFASLQPDRGSFATATVDDLFAERADQDDLQDESPYRVVALGGEVDEVQVTILVAASIEPAQAAVDELVPFLVGGLPLVLAIVGIVVWVLIGRGLQPVESMRLEAESISARKLDRRLQVPPSGDEIERLAETLNEMLARLEDSAQRQRRFVSDASHELKSPVAAIAAMLDAADVEGFADWDRLLVDLRREDLRLDGLAKDLLILAQIDERHVALERRNLDLDQVVGREIDVLRRTQAHPIDATGLRPMQMSGDTRALSHLFRNLLANATAHARSKVWVESEEIEGRITVTISDDGPGIPESERERVFERFVRLEESRSRDYGGTGLGLTVSRAIARALDGEVRFVEPDHGGASVVVELPLLANGRAADLRT